MKIVMATNNKGKISELKEMLSSFEVLSQKEAGIEDLNVEENGLTFEENAIIKANSIRGMIERDALIIAEDSGISIEALNGYPGTRTKRAACEEEKRELTDEERNNIYINKVEGLSNRKLVWQTAIHLIEPDGTTNTFIGEVEGEVAKKQIGDNGFGFDPIFYIPKENKTLAQMTFEEKEKYSARKRASEKLVKYLNEKYK